MNTKEKNCILLSSFVKESLSRKYCGRDHDSGGGFKSLCPVGLLPLQRETEYLKLFNSSLIKQLSEKRKEDGENEINYI
ncbi:MAG: hypothetical protein WCJ39_00120 [bacterium]